MIHRVLVWSPCPIWVIGKIWRRTSPQQLFFNSHHKTTTEDKAPNIPLFPKPTRASCPQAACQAHTLHPLRKCGVVFYLCEETNCQLIRLLSPWTWAPMLGANKMMPSSTGWGVNIFRSMQLISESIFLSRWLTSLHFLLDCSWQVCSFVMGLRWLLGGNLVAHHCVTSCSPHLSRWLTGMHYIVAYSWQMCSSVMGSRRLGSEHMVAHHCVTSWSLHLKQQFMRQHSKVARIWQMWDFAMKSEGSCPGSWYGVGEITGSMRTAWVGIAFLSDTTFRKSWVLYYQGWGSSIFKTCFSAFLPSSRGVWILILIPWIPTFPSTKIWTMLPRCWRLPCGNQKSPNKLMGTLTFSMPTWRWNAIPILCWWLPVSIQMSCISSNWWQLRLQRGDGDDNCVSNSEADLYFGWLRKSL